MDHSAECIQFSAQPQHDTASGPNPATCFCRDLSSATAIHAARNGCQYIGTTLLVTLCSSKYEWGLATYHQMLSGCYQLSMSQDSTSFLHFSIDAFSVSTLTYAQAAAASQAHGLS